MQKQQIQKISLLRIRLIRKSVTDQVDPEVIRMSATNAPPSAYLVCRHDKCTTFIAPNRSQRTHEPETMPQEKEKTREAQPTKME